MEYILSTLQSTTANTQNLDKYWRWLDQHSL